jgi:itaconate CoA-transferase
VTCEHAVAAPLATRHLADLGATVVKIERPGTGDFARHYDQAVLGQSSHFVWLNRGKQSLTLDLKGAQGRQIIAQLLERADIFVQNLGPGAAERLGLGGQDLTSRYPGLVICEISGYGPDGPWADRKAYDLLVQAETGLIDVTGTPEAPAKAGIPAADIAAGTYALSGILAALYRRERDGSGAVVQVSLLDGLAEWMGFPFYYARYGGSPPPRAGASHGAIAPYGPFRTSEGHDFLIGVQNDAEWVALCHGVIDRPDVAGDPRFATNSQRVAHRSLVDQAVAQGLALLTDAEAASRCDAARIAYSHLGPVAALEQNPQLAARGRWTEVGTPEGPVVSLLPPWVISGSAPVMGAVPAVGEHSEAILQGLGYSEEQIAELRESGVL